MEFDFDSEDNIKAAMTPSVEVLNDDAKLWISDECVEMSKWKGNLNPHDIKTDKERATAVGNIIPNPPTLILQRFLLLKVETKTGRILRAWIANESKEGDTYACAESI